MFVIHYFLNIYLLILIARLVMDYVMAFNRTFRPSGALAALFEFVYTVTDPPLKALRRVIPPLRVGNFSLDLGFIVLFIVIQVVNRQLR